MKRISLIQWLGLLLFLFLLLPFLFLLQKDLAYFSYKEVFYSRVSNDVVKAEKKPERVATLLNDYVFRNLYTPRCVPSADLDVYNSLISGVAFCDQRAWAMATLLGKQGMDSRMMMVQNPKKVSNHTILEMQIAGKPSAYDPFFGIGFNHGDTLYSYQDICARPALFFDCTPMNKLKKIDSVTFERTTSFFAQNVYYHPPAAPKCYGYSHRPNDFKRFVVTKIVAIYTKLFGTYFSNCYQDAYLGLYLNSSENKFEAARNYALFHRTQQAVEAYKDVIANHSPAVEREKALFFLGVCYYQIQEEKLSIHTFDKLIAQYPETHWRTLAYYYTGLDYIAQKQTEKAQQYFLQALGLAKGKILSPTEALCVEKLGNL